VQIVREFSPDAHPRGRALLPIAALQSHLHFAAPGRLRRNRQHAARASADQPTALAVEQGGHERRLLVSYPSHSMTISPPGIAAAGSIRVITFRSPILFLHANLFGRQRSAAAIRRQ
jgi:hypothetical protein